MSTEAEAQYQQTLYTSYASSSQQFEKLSIFIASGAFSLSFTFISEIIELKKAHQKWMLSSSWGIFLLVIFIALTGHYFSTLIHTLAIKHAGLEATDYNKKIKPWNFCIHVLNASIIVGLAAAAYLLILFIHKNI